MRPWLVAVLLVLVALPALAAPDCADVRDPALLPAPGAVLAAAAQHGFALQPAPPSADLVPSLPVDLHACTGMIRPGAPLIINGAFLCTANWVFTDEQGARYIGTAGHCIPDLSWDRIAVEGVSDDIGDPAFTTGDAGVGNDFALIRIDPALYAKVDPTMCRWGGPASLGTPANTLPADGVLQYGWGFVYGETAATRPRVGSVNPTSWEDHDLLLELNVAGGDSGSGVETRDGKAIGIVTHTFEVPGTVPVGVGLTYATRLDHALELADQGTGHTFALKTSVHGTDLLGLTIP
jgi:hypothetical protein